jgi:hypothetical protein
MRRHMTSQGHHRTVLRRALEHGNLLLAEVTPREVRVIDLGEVLELTALVALHDRSRLGRFAARWLERYLTEVVPYDRRGAVRGSCLSALGGPRLPRLSRRSAR